MKGKIILSGLSLLLCVTLTACGSSSETAAVTNLANQLDKTNNSIASIKQVADTDIDMTEEMLDKLATENKNESVQKNLNITKNTLMLEQLYKANVMYETAKIKRYLAKEDVKLAKNQVSAIKDLTASLSKYNNSVAYSGNEFNSTYRNYNKMKKTANKNAERVNAKLNKLACNSNARCSYYENLLNTLKQVEDVLGIQDDYVALPPYENTPDSNITQPTPENGTENIENEITNETPEVDNSTDENTLNNINKEDETNKEDNNQKNKSIKNIDTFDNQAKNKTNNLNNVNDSQNNQTYNKNVAPTPYVSPAPYQGNTPPYTNMMPPYQGSNMVNNPNYYNAIGRRHVLNPNRNTDTYGPTMKNIDTYRNNYEFNNGIYNGNYGINNGINNGSNNGIYNSNNINRLTYPMASTKEVKDEKIDEVKDETNKIEPEKRIEEFENETKENLDNEIKIKEIDITTLNKVEEIGDDEERVVAHDKNKHLHLLNENEENIQNEKDNNDNSNDKDVENTNLLTDNSAENKTTENAGSENENKENENKVKIKKVKYKNNKWLIYNKI